MHSEKIPEIFPVVLILIILALCIVPAYAQNGTVSIEYRGAGGYYVGDSIIFDGKNTIGNTTVIKITGPGLPAEGVPPYNLTDAPGTGNTVVTDASGTWSFYWDSSRAVGTENLDTARYTFTVFDMSNPQDTASSSVYLRGPEFYVTMSPNPAALNDYVQLVGKVETASDTMEINVMDISGNKVHTYNSPVSAGGYFQYGFHVDMPPGLYTVTINSPSIPEGLTKTLTVSAANPNATIAETASTTTITVPGANTTGISVTPQVTPNVSPYNGTLVVSSIPAGASVYLDSVVVGKTPLTLNTVKPGSHTVEIKSSGYLPVSIDIVVSEDKPTEIAPELVKAPFGLPLSPLTVIAGCLGAMVLVLAERRRKQQP
ncbi:MAG: PEGA domain-containing protein [Methanoregula sp.]|uniref:PEGA domain-containing protein n=1 Tax=Methanoregula sp. TaxID=2052170 RepID=UPI003BC16FCA